MKKILTLFLFFFLLDGLFAQSAEEIIKQVDQNMVSSSHIATTKMIIYGRRTTREVVSKNYSEGNEKAFTEYLAPAREEGTKMLKLDDRLWIYNPAADRTIQISGHMLKQSVMGSDLSYEDMMEERSLLEVYAVSLKGKEEIKGHSCWKLHLEAKVDDATYQKQVIWVDLKKMVPRKQEMYAKSGTLLKQVKLDAVKQFGNRWYPTQMNYKDMLKEGKGTDFIIQEIEFDSEIPAFMFTKAALRK